MHITWSKTAGIWDVKQHAVSGDNQICSTDALLIKKSLTKKLICSQYVWLFFLTPEVKEYRTSGLSLAALSPVFVQKKRDIKA